MEAVIAPSLALHPSLVVRMVSFLALPFSLSVPLLAALGMHNRLIANNPSTAGANLFACNHRSMLDPLYVSAAGRADLAAATYNISRILEIMSPIPTFRLTRGRAAMQAKLSGGSGLVVCPEGTTCREPFLLLLPWTGSRWISLRVIVLPWIGSRRRWGVDDVVGPMRQ